MTSNLSFGQKGILNLEEEKLLGIKLDRPFHSSIDMSRSSLLKSARNCNVISTAWSNDFETNIDCWAVINNGDANGWSLFDNSAYGGGAISYGIQYGTSAHDDHLISPVFEVIESVSNRLTFDARNFSSSFVETIDVQVWNPEMTSLLETIAFGLTPGTSFESYTFDLSAFVGLDICFSFYITTTNQYYIFIDNIVVDSDTSLGFDTVSSRSSFSFFPNPVNDYLTIKAQTPIESVIIFNVLGQAVIRLRPNTVNTRVDMSDFQAGTYFLEFSVNKTYKRVRVIKS